MDNLGSNFLSADAGFGIQQASVISDETAELLFGGGSPTVDPTKVAPIQKKDKRKPAVVEPIKDEDEEDEQDPLPESPSKMSADELLDNLGTDEEEEEDAPQASPKPKTKPEPPTELDDDTTFTDITKELVKMGIFKQRDEDDTKPVKTGEELRDRFIREDQEKLNANLYNFFISKHGEEGLEIADAIFSKGMDPKEYLSMHSKLKSIEGLDLSVEENQKQVYREAYRKQGLADDKIERNLQRTIDYGDLDEVSRDLHEILVKQEREDMNIKLAEQDEAREMETQRKMEYSNNLNLIFNQKLKDRDFDGIPVTEKAVRETYDYLTTERWVTPTGEKLTDFDKDILDLRDPKNHEKKVKLALLLRSGIDLSKVKAKAITNESNEVFDTLVKRNAVQKRTQKSRPTPGSFLDSL